MDKIPDEQIKINKEYSEIELKRINDTNNVKFETVEGKILVKDGKEPKSLITKEMYDLTPISDFEFTKDRKYVVNMLKMLDAIKDPEYMTFEEEKSL